MENREIGPLERVELTAIWKDEPTFTQWLAEHLVYLQPAVNVDLKLVQPEHQQHRAGRVDILAQDVKSGRTVVIENQFNGADNDHFARTVGYAASREARFLIWIAPEFSKWHLDIMLWLNAAGIEIFGIKISAYRIGNAYAPLFELVAGPDDSANLTESTAPDGPNIYSRFYRPLVKNLREEGIRAMSGRDHGFVGRYRRYRSGTLLEDAGITYYSTLGRGDEQCKVGLLLHGGEHSFPYSALFDHRSKLEDSMGCIEIAWSEGEMEDSISVSSAGIPDEEEATLENTREWMKLTLLCLRDNCEPMLQEIITG